MICNQKGLEGWSMTAERVLLTAVKYILDPDDLSAKERLRGTDSVQWSELLLLAQKHSLENLLYYILPELPEACQPESALTQRLKRAALVASAKSCTQLHAAEELLGAFEAHGVDAMLLKGINTKKRYRRDDLRTMGDVDVLYKPAQQAQVQKVLQALGYAGFKEGQKHDHYSRKPYVSLEMHRELVASDSQYAAYYEDIWERSQRKAGYAHIFEMPLEDEFIFNFVHLTEHFKAGGIGVRLIMDVYVYLQQDTMDMAYIEGELKKLGLAEFYHKIQAVALKWFGRPDSQPEEPVVPALEAFILNSGLFGTQENAAALAVGQGGRGDFLLRTCFPSLKRMQSMYPWLKKWPVLLPYAWARRGVGTVLFRNYNLRSEYKKLTTGDKTLGRDLQDFYRECGL